MPTATFDQPHEVTDLDMAFGYRGRDLMPSYSEIPEDFRKDRGEARKWVAFQQQWFFEGITRSMITPRPDVDMDKALRHLKAIQGSFEPKHEHKEAAVAYLASLWFADVAVTR